MNDDPAAAAHMFGAAGMTDRCVLRSVYYGVLRCNIQRYIARYIWERTVPVHIRNRAIAARRRASELAQAVPNFCTMQLRSLREEAKECSISGGDFQPDKLHGIQLWSTCRMLLIPRECAYSDRRVSLILRQDCSVTGLYHLLCKKDPIKRTS